MVRIGGVLLLDRTELAADSEAYRMRLVKLEIQRATADCSTQWRRDENTALGAIHTCCFASQTVQLKTTSCKFLNT